MTVRIVVLTMIALVSMSLSNPSQGQLPETGFLDRSVVVDGDRYRFQVYVPRGYDGSEVLPVILSLHGIGERGSDGLIQTQIGMGEAIRRYPERYKAIVVFPQTPVSWDGLGEKIAMAALDAAMDEYNVDRSRVYLTGLSMGGYGSWYVATRNPDRFAAMVVVCGWVSERDDWQFPPVIDETDDIFSAVADRLKHIPIWIFHGDADTVVPVEESQNMNLALLTLDADVQYVEFVDVGHNAWDPAYSFGELPRWLFSKSLE